MTSPFSRVLTVLTLVLATVVTAVAEPSEKPLRMSVHTGKAITRAVRATVPNGKTPFKGELVHDLLDEGTGASIPADRLQVKLAPGRTTNERIVLVTFLGSDTLGSFASEIRLASADGAVSVRVPVELTVRAMPRLVLDEGSKKGLLVRATNPWPLAKGDAVGATVDLTSMSASDVAILDISLDTLRSTGRDELPVAAVNVALEPQARVPAWKSARLALDVTPKGLAAGSYTGTARVQIVDAPSERISVPVQVDVKHGPLYPLITLLVGMLAAWVLGWWKSEGRAASKLLTKIDQLSADVAAVASIPVGERQQIVSGLERAYEAVERKEGSAKAEPLVEAAQKVFDETRAAVDKLVVELENPFTNAPDGMPPRVEAGLRAEIEEARRRIEEGRVGSVEAATSTASEARLAYTEGRRLAEAELKRFLALESKPKALVIEEFEAATTVKEMQDALSVLAAVAVVPQPGLAYTTDTLADMRRTAAVAPWNVRLERQRNWMRLASVAAPLVVYGVTLAVGWISQYLASETFGAHPNDYLNLLLWGGIVESVRGKAMTFPGLSEVVKKDVPGK